MTAQLGPSSSTTYAAEPAVQVNPTSPGRQQMLAASATPGGHAIAWLSQDDGYDTVQLRRYDAQGQPAGSEVVIGVDTLQEQPGAAVLADGALVVATAIAGPVSVDQPWITRSSIRVQRFDAAGRAAGDVDVGVVQQNRIGATTMRFVADPAVIGWDDGSFLVGWALVEEDANGRLPQFWVQRFSAAGQPVGAASFAAPGELDSGFRLTASPHGGWLLTTMHRTMGRTFLRYHPFEGAVAPQLPAGATGMAEGSLLVPLHGGGSVLLQPAKTYGSLQLYGSNGQAQGLAGALPTPPLAATALRDGGFVVFSEGAAGQLVGQRFDAAAQPVGDPVALAAAAAQLQGAALADGGLVIGWTATRADGSTDVMAQRLR